jgi:hypothetical protein
MLNDLDISKEAAAYMSNLVIAKYKSNKIKKTSLNRGCYPEEENSEHSQALLHHVQ